MKIFYYGLVLLFSVALWGCSSSNGGSGVDPSTGKHVAGWAANGTGGAHPAAYFADAAGCASCHGADLKGGISGVSCSNPGRSGVNCHATFPHAAGFSAFNVHGNSAKAAASSFTGLAHCQKCHGTDYTGKSPAPSCIGCHKLSNPASNAPHAYNWVSGNANGLQHSTTDISNAPACFQCHAGGQYSHAAPAPAPAGTAPGCFNGTMCHNNAGHAFNVTGHYVPARSNLASCQSCHATPATGSNPRFNVSKGTTSAVTGNGCENCHTQPGLAHPYVWLPGRGGSPTASHANAQNIYASCGLCHGGATLNGGGTAYPGGISPPSCFPARGSVFGGTACHFVLPIDAQGVSVGCVSCHSTPPNSASTTTAPNRAYKHTNHFATATYSLGSLTCAACHTGFGAGTTSHATKAVFTAVTASVAMPAAYNENGATAAYSSTTQRCTNVSCHGGKTIAVNWKSTTVFNMTNCSNCHTIQPAPGILPASYTGPYIGPFSGYIDPVTGFNNLHTYHIVFAIGGGSASCVNCHTNPVPNHFANITLGKRTLNRGVAAPSIGGPGTSIGSYDPVTSSCLTNTSVSGLSCHDTGAKIWFGP